MSFNIINDYNVKDTPHTINNEIIDYGVKMIGAPLEWSETEGEGIKVGIIDTGVDLNHEDLIGRISDYYNFTSSDVKDVNDENGHGTHVAGIIAANRNNIGIVGVAPKCKLYIAKAFNSDGSGDNKNIANAIQWLISKNVSVINMSFTTQKYNRDFEYYINKCYSKGIMCVCAAGNSGADSDIEFPAKFKETISVTAIDINKEIADFSSRGEKADISAPGKDILSTYPNNKYVTLSGTSMAAPLITGAIAILQSKAKIRFNRLLNPTEIKLILNMYTDDLGVKGKDENYGYGLFSFGRIKESEYINSKKSTTVTISNPTLESSTSTISSYRIKKNPEKIHNEFSDIFYISFLLKIMGFNL